ncbi:unnamed protein product [Chrysodeixis includens]|uniref:Alpha-1,3-glucosyltransferase n=1 Tax=Chrysodeixis includens TaxID=689277 RepID=A0A9P0BTZ3_CHRIL|nr:unnamed protein product [Chrysodeixis includens]
MTRRADPDKFTVTKEALLPGLLFAMLVRWCVAAYPYSGYKTPPMYGDYEAQRHWQEITVHTPKVKWYHNTTQNDLQYWGLDYPPLTAYHSLLMGLVADWLDPESVRLFASRGYENDFHKTFMRWTVFLSDIYFYFTVALCICMDAERVLGKEARDKSVFKRTDIATTLFLLYPGIILIDHGHFQYNCVSLGLFLWATFFIIAIENDTLATIFFVFALNYKQMELYHALPFFFYLLRKCFIGMPLGRGKFVHFVRSLNKLAIAVVSTFVIVWYPFLNGWDNVFQVLNRLFPLNRGIFEDKVSNVWCMVNVFIKLKTIYTNQEMAKTCLLITAMAAGPACVDLFFRISKKKFVPCLINVSLAFFLFSFQVHEKSILLVAIPVALHLPEDPFMCFWFLLVSNFSMLPLLVKDGLFIPFIATNLIYTSFYSICLRLSQPNSGYFSIFNANRVAKILQPNKKDSSPLLSFLSLIFFFSIIGMILLTIGTVFVEPPPQYPDIFPLLVSAYSCAHFLFFFFYFYYQQFSLPMCLPAVTKVKRK